jgi:hypothetical protein
MKIWYAPLSIRSPVTSQAAEALPRSRREAQADTSGGDMSSGNAN